MSTGWAILVGTGAQVASMFVLAVVAFNAFSARVTIFENTLKAHAEALVAHSERMDRTEAQMADRIEKTEARMLQIIADLQRLIGRSELTFREKRPH